LPPRGALAIGKDIDVAAREQRPKRWRDIWSAGHATSGVTDIPTVEELVARTIREYRAVNTHAPDAISVRLRLSV
jgi:nitronate monooxygenase